MSFALTCFHVLMLIILIPRAQFCSAIHDGFWPVKYVLMLGIFIAAWFIKPQFFVVWGNICRGFSIVYLFVQAYFIMNLTYLWNDYLMAAIAMGEQCYAKFLLLAVSILASCGSLVWLVFCFKWFWGCGTSNFFLIETCILLLWFYVAALLRLCNVTLRENYTIFVCSMATVYLVYQLWSSLASLPNSTCNDLALNKGNTALQIIIGALFSFITVISIAIASQTSSESSAQKTTTAGASVVAEQVDDEARPIDEEAAIFPVTVPTLIFQAIMVLSSFYYGMLFTNWGNVLNDGVAEKTWTSS